MKRTLEETIKYYSELAEENEKDAEQFKRLRVTQDVISYCYECAKEHKQLAEWLRKLKAYEEAYEKIRQLPIAWEFGEGVIRCLTIIEDCLEEVNADEEGSDSK